MKVVYPASAAAVEEDSEAEDVIMAEFWKRKRREEKIEKNKTYSLPKKNLPAKRVFTSSIQILAGTTFWEEFAQLGSHSGQICRETEVCRVGNIISHTLLSTRRDTKETNRVKNKENENRLPRLRLQQLHLLLRRVTQSPVRILISGIGAHVGHVCTLARSG